MLKKLIAGIIIGAGLIFANVSPTYAYTANPITVNGGVDVSCGGDVIAFLKDNGFWRRPDSTYGWCYTNGSMDIFMHENSTTCRSISGYANIITDYGGLKIGSTYDEVISVFGKCLGKRYPLEGNKTPDVGYEGSDEGGILLAYPGKDKGEIRFFISHKTHKVFEIELF